MMTRSRAIRVFCTECAGGSAKDALLCTGFDCPLWPHRAGSPGALRRRMETARRTYARDLAELEAQGIDIARFFEIRGPCRPARKGPVFAKNDPATLVLQESDGGGR